MIFSCRNCGKRYRIDMSAYEGHAVRWSCTKCGQEHVLKESDILDDAVVAVGQKGMPIQSNTQEIFTITSRSTRRESDLQGNPTVRSGGWHVTVLGQRQGPLNDYGLMELLAAGKINPRTYIWRSPMATWVRMKDLKEVEGLLAQAASGAAARHDNVSWPSRQTSPGIELPAEPPLEPSPWDSRITTRADQGEQTGRHGIKATPTSGVADGSVSTGRADELFRDLENRTMDIRSANTVPMTDDDENRPTRDEFWHSPEPRREDTRIRENNNSFGSEITQPGKRTQQRRNRERRKLIVIGVIIGVIALAVIILALALKPESHNDKKTVGAKANAAATVSRDRVDMPPAQQRPAPAVVTAPSTAPITAPAAQPEPGPDAAPAMQAAPAAVPTPAPTPQIVREEDGRGSIALIPDGAFDEEDLTTFVQEQVPGFSTCRKVMAKNVDTAIKVNMMFTVAVSGDIETLVITPIDINDPALNVCMQTLIRKWSFPTVPRPLGFKGTVVIP